MVTAQARGSFLESQDFLLQGGELQHAQRVVFCEEAAQRVPAPADTHHHVFTVEHPDEDGLISEAVASLRQILDGNSVGTVAGWVVHAVLPGLVEAAMLAAHAEGFDGGGRLLRHQQRLLQLDLFLQLHQHRRLHAVL